MLSNADIILTKIQQSILIVDDTLKNIQVLGKILRNQGYHIFIAQNGMQAIESAKTNIPDLILLDVMMPGISGFETCKQLKTINKVKDIPIIFITAQVEDNDVIKGFEVGAVDYITKPFNLAILLARTKTHLTLHQQTKQLYSLANLDGLTMIANRRRLNKCLLDEWQNSFLEQIPLSLLILDIDYFKNYNDNYGHLAGDDTLKSIAKVLNNICNHKNMLVARYGGEEFVIVLTNTNVDKAQEIANYICKAIFAINIEHKYSEIEKVVTISVGGATIIPNENDNLTKFLSTVDKQLFEAKKNGRNQVRYKIN
jgi:diguanylate cyclase (GGDEF)-like protein